MADILDFDPAKGPGVDLTPWLLALLCRVQISTMPAGVPKDKALAVLTKLLPYLQAP